MTATSPLALAVATSRDPRLASGAIDTARRDPRVIPRAADTAPR